MSINVSKFYNTKSVKWQRIRRENFKKRKYESIEHVCSSNKKEFTHYIEFDPFICAANSTYSLRR